MTEAHPAHLTGNASRDDEGTTAALGRLVINNRIAKALGITKRKEERKSHERNQYISRGVSRQQDEPANDSMERPSRSGTACEAKRGGNGFGRRGPKNIKPQSSAWADRSARPKKSPNAASKIPAMRWAPTRSFARIRMRLRPSCSRGIRTLQSFPGNPSRSCPFCRFRAPNRQRPKIWNVYQPI